MNAIRNPHLAAALGLVLAGGLAAAPAAFAQDTGASGKRFAIVGGYAHQEPTGNATLDGAEAEFDGTGAPTLSASYYINDHIAIEAWARPTSSSTASPPPPTARSPRPPRSRMR